MSIYQFYREYKRRSRVGKPKLSMWIWNGETETQHPDNVLDWLSSQTLLHIIHSSSTRQVRNSGETRFNGIPGFNYILDLNNHFYLELCKIETSFWHKHFYDLIFQNLGIAYNRLFGSVEEGFDVPRCFRLNRKWKLETEKIRFYKIYLSKIHTDFKLLYYIYCCNKFL